MPLTLFVAKFFNKIEQRMNTSAAVIGYLHSHTQRKDEINKVGRAILFEEARTPLMHCIKKCTAVSKMRTINGVPSPNVINSFLPLPSVQDFELQIDQDYNKDSQHWEHAYIKPAVPRSA